jgi:hypothetical protein
MTHRFILKDSTRFELDGRLFELETMGYELFKTANGANIHARKNDFASLESMILRANLGQNIDPQKVYEVLVDLGQLK